MIPRGVTVAGQPHVSQRAIAGLDCLLVGLAVVVASVNAFLLYPELRHDGVHHLQYARNLASGNGMVFNPGERVLGTTTPLYALVLAGVYLVFGDVLPRAAVVIGSFAVAVQALLLERILRP